MTIPHDVAHCVGQSVPFGQEYTSECQNCARSVSTSHPKSWMGPVTFTDACPLKIRIYALHGQAQTEEGF